MKIAGQPQSRTVSGLATAAAALFVIGLFATVGFQSPGYDDEFVNIDIVQTAKSYADIVAFANTQDFHPPGQYVINKFLFDLLGDWSRVRAAGAAIAGATIVNVWLSTKARSDLGRAFAWLVICLNPALLLRCTGLRWDCPFVVLLDIVLLILMRPPRRPLLYWGALITVLLALLHVSYLSLLIGPIVIAVALYQRRATLAGELPILGGGALIAAVLAWPQLNAFFSVHFKSAEVQTFDMLSGVGTMALHLTSGQAAMPLSTAGLALAAANLAVFFVAVRHWKSIAQQPVPQLLGGSILAILASRLGGKLHTLAALSPLQGVLQMATYEQTSSVAVRGLLLVLFTVGNIGGVINVATHANTTKGSWNTPYPLVLETFRARTADCAATMAITHDPVLAFYLRQRASDVITLEDEDWQDRLRAWRVGCLVAFQTFRGSLSKEDWLAYATAIKSLPGSASVDRLGLDTFAAFKRRFDPDVPDDYVTMTLFRQ